MGLRDRIDRFTDKVETRMPESTREDLSRADFENCLDAARRACRCRRTRW